MLNFPLIAENLQEAYEENHEINKESSQKNLEYKTKLCKIWKKYGSCKCTSEELHFFIHPKRFSLKEAIEDSLKKDPMFLFDNELFNSKKTHRLKVFTEIPKKETESSTDEEDTSNGNIDMKTPEIMRHHIPIKRLILQDLRNKKNHPKSDWGLPQGNFW